MSRGSAGDARACLWAHRRAPPRLGAHAGLHARIQVRGQPQTMSLGCRCPEIPGRGIRHLAVRRAGALSLGTLSLGVLSLGALSLGALSLGALSLGALSLGALSLAALSLVGVSFAVPQRRPTFATPE